MAPRYIDKGEVLDRIPVSYVTIWTWMRAGTFPRSRIINNKSMWLESEVTAWMLKQPTQRFGKRA
jgi:predicted DNA-binding transcriptional regulator AlpA